MTNRYKVPVKVWRRWSPQAQEVFNLVYRDIRGNQGIYLHPKTSRVSREQWRTTAWNAAWTAANAAEEVQHGAQ